MRSAERARVAAAAPCRGLINDMAEQSAVHSAVRTAERAAPSTRRAFTAVLAVLAVLTGLHVAALTLFTSGFLLQRVELVSENACTPSGGATKS